MASTPVAHTPARVQIPADLKERANGMLAKFNSDAMERGLNHAIPYATGVGTLVLATAVDGFGEGMDWHYPEFMQKSFLGKIDWRLYGTAVAGVAYVLESETDYEGWQETTAAVGVGLLGSYVMTKLWDGPRAWGEKLADWIGDQRKTKADKADKGYSARAGSPVLVDGVQKKTADGKGLVYGSDGVSEVVSAGLEVGDASGYLDESGAADTVTTPEGRRLRRLHARMARIDKRKGNVQDKIDAQGAAQGGRRGHKQIATQQGWRRTPNGAIVIPPGSPLQQQYQH